MKIFRQMRLIPILGLMAIGVLLVGLPNRTNIKRRQLEKMLINQAQFIQPSGVKKDYPAKDRPDLAAFADYTKTVDPKEKRVPMERWLPAHQNTLKQNSLKNTSGLIWKNHSANLGGRTRSVFYDPNDPTGKRAFAGAVTGGLWVNSDPSNGSSWEPLGDFWPSLSVSCVAADPGNPQSLFVGTGESETAMHMYRESSSKGVGLMHSSDGGSTWALLPSTSKWAYISDIIINVEQGISVIYAGVVSGLYKGSFHESEPMDGLYRSVDGGTSWSQVLPLISGTKRAYAPSDIELTSNGRIFVGTTYHGESKEGAACILYSDDGVNWNVNANYQEQISEGLSIPASQRIYNFPGRVILASAPGTPSVVYALIAAGYTRDDGFLGYDCALILRSDDNGQTWTNKENIPMWDPPYTFAYLAWHALTIAVDPDHQNTIWIGGLDVWRSTDGAESWHKMSNWAPGSSPELQAQYVHADIHSILFKPGSDQEILIGTDGGVFYSNEAHLLEPSFVESNNNYNTLQFYSGAIHPNAGKEYFLGGLQDNGTIQYYPAHYQEKANEISGGDGAFCFIDQDEPNIQISTAYFSWINIFNSNPLDQTKLLNSFNYNFGTFINPMDYDWKYNVIYANGVSFNGTNANTIGVIRLNGSKMEGGLKDVPTDSDVPFSALKWHEESGLDASVLYMGTESGRLFRLDDAIVIGDLTEVTGNLPAGYISSIDLGQTEDTLLVTFSNYGISSVWISVDRGTTWDSIDTNLPDMPIRCGIFHPENRRQIMLATETGIWSTEDCFAEEVSWKPDLTGMANVRVDMLKVRRSDNTVLAATHGRGLYTAHWPASITSGIPEYSAKETLSLYPNPTHGSFSFIVPTVGDYHFLIFNTSGKAVFERKLSITAPNQQILCDLTGHKKGIYLANLVGKNGISSSRILLQ